MLHFPGIGWSNHLYQLKEEVACVAQSLHIWQLYAVHQGELQQLQAYKCPCQGRCRATHNGSDTASHPFKGNSSKFNSSHFSETDHSTPSSSQGDYPLSSSLEK